MADRKTSEHFHNLKEGSDPKRPMLVQSASRHHHDALPDGSNGVKDNERQRQKDSYKKSHSKSQQKINESGPGSHIYTFHEGSPGELIKVSTSTSSFDTAHHKKRSKTTSPKNRQDHVEGVHAQPHRAQASHSTLEALMARGPISQERLMSDRASPVGSFIPSPPQTKSASLSRDISPSRITAQVVSVLENYNYNNPPLLHSALTGKLTQSPGGSAPPPNRTIVKSVHPIETDHQRMNSATLKHLQEASAESKRWGAQHRLPQALQQTARSGTAEGSHVTLSARSHSPKSSHMIHVSERNMPFKSLPSSHFEKDKKGAAHEQHSVGQTLHGASHHDISSVLNNVPTTVVYSHSPVRGPAVSSTVSPISVSGSIPSVRATPPVVRFIGPGDVPLPPNLQNLIMSMSESPGVTTQALAERIEAELKSQSAQKRTPSPAKQPTEHASPSSYARHPSSSPQTIYRTSSPSHSGHRVQVNTSNPQTIHRTVSPSHGLHRLHGHVSPVSQSQFPQEKVGPVPSRPHGRASPGSAHVTVISGRVSPVPRHTSPHSQRLPGSSLSPNQGRVSPAPAHPDHVYRGRVSPVQDPRQMGGFPPPAHKHPELPPACRSGFPAVDLTHKHKQQSERRAAPVTQCHRDPSSVLSSALAQSLGHAQAAVSRPFSIPQPQVRVSAQPHVVKTEPGTISEQRGEQHHDFHPISQAPPSLPVSSAAGKFLPQPVPARLPESKGPVPPHINPFTFPSKAITSHVPIPSFTVGSDSNSGNQDKQKTPLSAPFFPRSASDTSDLRRPIRTEKENQSEMPRLVPEVPLVKKEERDEVFGAFNHVGETSQAVGGESWIKPFNMRLQNLANFPVNNTTYRSAYRAQSVAVQRAKACSITSAAKSLDILRQNLQRNINKEIDQIVKGYIDKFFKPAINNIQINNGQNAVSDEHLHAVQRQILEEAKKMYVMETRRSVTPVRDDTDTVSETGSNSGKRAYVRRRRPSDSNSEAGSDISVPKIKKRKGRPPLHQSGRGTPLRSVKPNEPVKREGPKWDPDRLTQETKFVMGARANKALGLGATRGRLYIKHPDIFKYSGDQDDKAWLYEHHLMPATGGKAYMLLVDDIQDLSQTDEYRDSPNLLMDELYGFTVPDWILKKMSIQMNAMRTDMGRPKFQRSRSGTPTDMLPSYRDMDDDPPKTLPFSNFSDNPSTYPMSKSDAQVSPSNDAGDEMEFLSAADNESAAPDLSPFNVSARFDDMNSPSPPEVDNLDDPTFVLK